MSDQDCIAFLQWALPRMQLRWPGFRKVRGQVCRRLAKRVKTLGLPGLAAYRAHLAVHPGEWNHLDGLCRVTISRFYRDRGVWDALRANWLPALARQALAGGRPEVRVWSAGCASGEEPYTLAACWRLELARDFPELALQLVAMDLDAHLLERAHNARYPAGCLREFPASWRGAAFQTEGIDWIVRPPLRAGVTFRRMDLRRRMPRGPFDLILCRNLAFTYFDTPLQQTLAAKMGRRLRPGGLLLLGRHERLPDPTPGLAAVRPPQTDLWRRV